MAKQLRVSPQHHRRKRSGSEEFDSILDKVTLNERRFSLRIDADSRAAAHREMQIQNILLLGPASSGKTTLSRALALAFPSESDRNKLDDPTKMRIQIHKHIITIVQTLVKLAQSLEESNPSLNTKINPALKDEADDLLEWSVVERTHAFSADELSTIKRLLSDDGIKNALINEQLFAGAVPSNADAILSNLDQWCDESKTLTSADLLMISTRSTRLRETMFMSSSTVTYRTIDIANQNSEMKKWLPLFEDVPIIMFVVDMSMYDDAEAIEAARHIYTTISSSRWFGRSKLILMLTKKDIFEEKKSKVPLKDHFPEAIGEHT
jgi:hypothetical protein